MRRLRFAFVLFTVLVGSVSLLRAQTTAGSSGTGALGAGAPVTDLSKLDLGATLQQMQAATAEGSPDAPSPLQIVVAFLQLQPAQQNLLGQLLQARQTAVAPLFQGIEQKKLQLKALLDTGGNPAQIGLLALQIHALQQQIVQAQQGFLASFEQLLTQDQQERLAAVCLATQLQPVVPAFQRLQLF